MEFPTYLTKQKYNTLDNIPNVDEVIEIDICTVATLHSNVAVPSTLDVITKIDKILVQLPHITPLNMYVQYAHVSNIYFACYSQLKLSRNVMALSNLSNTSRTLEFSNIAKYRSLNSKLVPRGAIDLCSSIIVNGRKLKMR